MENSIDESNDPDTKRFLNTANNNGNTSVREYQVVVSKLLVSVLLFTSNYTSFMLSHYRYIIIYSVCFCRALNQLISLIVAILKKNLNEKLRKLCLILNYVASLTSNS